MTVTKKAENNSFEVEQANVTHEMVMGSVSCKDDPGTTKLRWLNVF